MGNLEGFTGDSGAVGKSASRLKIPVTYLGTSGDLIGTALTGVQLSHPGAQCRSSQWSRITRETAGGSEAITIMGMCFLLIRCR